MFCRGGVFFVRIRIKLLVGLLFFLAAGFSRIHAKQVLVDASSFVKQTKFVTRSGDTVFTDKYQKLNGKVTKNWYINNVDVSESEYAKNLANAEKEEKEIAKEEEIKKREAEAQRLKEIMEQKKKEEEEFLKSTKMRGLKRLVQLQANNLKNSFERLEKYQLDEYFVWEDESFSDLEDFEQTKFGLLEKVKELDEKPKEYIFESELNNMLLRLEAVPARIERFFRKSVRYAIDNCSDTKRLKELLALI